MTNDIDDLPHPVPPLAGLRYKENYFFVIVAPESGVFGMAHLSHEPGFDRARYSCNLSVDGRVLTYADATPFPSSFEGAPEIGNDRLRLAFVKPHREFRLRLDSDDLEFDLTFTRKHPTFDYTACRAAAPENPSFQEVMTLGLNLPYNHQQQAMYVSGAVTVRDTGATRQVEGFGYRDHSWCVRTDGIVLNHDWVGINFEDRAFGIKTIETRHRPGLRAKEGYVAEGDQLFPLRLIEVERIGGTIAVPDTVVHHLVDVRGQAFTIESDVRGRLADVSLESEAPAGDGSVWAVAETFCRSVLRETGAVGYSLVELGQHFNDHGGASVE